MLTRWKPQQQNGPNIEIRGVPHNPFDFVGFDHSPLLAHGTISLFYFTKGWGKGRGMSFDGHTCACALCGALCMDMLGRLRAWMTVALHGVTRCICDVCEDPEWVMQVCKQRGVWQHTSRMPSLLSPLPSAPVKQQSQPLPVHTPPVFQVLGCRFIIRI